MHKDTPTTSAGQGGWITETRRVGLHPRTHRNPSEWLVRTQLAVLANGSSGGVQFELLVSRRTPRSDQRAAWPQDDGGDTALREGKTGAAQRGDRYI